VVVRLDPALECPWSCPDGQKVRFGSSQGRLSGLFTEGPVLGNRRLFVGQKKNVGYPTCCSHRHPGNVDLQAHPQDGKAFGLSSHARLQRTGKKSWRWGRIAEQLGAEASNHPLLRESPLIAAAPVSLPPSTARVS